jgi:micrococcal nuclease
VIRLAIICAFGFALYSCGTDMRSEPAKTARSASYEVVRVVDGDTIKVRAGGEDKSVRLIGIDTPETRKPGVKVECGGKAATANMVKLAPEGAKAKLTFDPSQDKEDRYGRLLAYVKVRGKDVQLEQIYDGLAEVYVYDKNFDRVEKYRRAEVVAERAGRGVWGHCDGDFHSEQPGDQARSSWGRNA